MIIDAVQLEVFQNLLSSVAEEMGLRLQHSAFSPNIKERRDYSCAIFDDRGEMIALALHIPVHLGSTPLAVREMIRELGTLGEGDTAIANDPYLGGSHLPDVTALTPVCVDGKARFYVANRAHHADVGGLNSGSMGLATEIYHEGLRIPPVRLVVGGQLNSDVHRLLMANMRGSAEREGDFAAQLAANHAGVLRMLSIIEKYGYRPVGAAAQELTLYAERCVREAIRRIPNGTYAFTDQLDDDGTSEQPITIAVKIDVRGDELEIDFAGTSPQVPGPLNANEAITLSAVFYVLKSLVGFRIPDNAGSLRPVHLKIPEGSLLNPRMPAAVAGGNVETSQRIVDVLLGAFGQAIRVPAASVGTMTNLSIGGQDPRTGEAFAYYETIGGGMGASAESRGVDAVQCHMTNTRNTPIEVLENAYPLRVTEYSVRRGSGGRGDHEGGDGTVREIEILSDVSASILADRHRQGPYGLGGAEPGRPGKTILTRAGGKPETVPSKANLKLGPGDRLRLETPGGGGWSAKGAPKAVIQISPGDIPAIEAREVRRERAKPVVEAEAPAPEEIETPEARPAPEAAERAKRPDRAQAGPADESATEERSRRGRRRRKRRPDDEADNGAPTAAPVTAPPTPSERPAAPRGAAKSAPEARAARDDRDSEGAADRQRRGRRSQRRQNSGETGVAGPISTPAPALEKVGENPDHDPELEVVPGPVPPVDDRTEEPADDQAGEQTGEHDAAGEDAAPKRRRRGRRGGRRRRRKDTEGDAEETTGSEAQAADEGPVDEDEDGGDDDDNGGGAGGPPPTSEASEPREEEGSEPGRSDAAPPPAPAGEERAAPSRAGAALKSTRDALRRIAGLLIPEERAKAPAEAAPPAPADAPVPPEAAAPSEESDEAPAPRRGRGRRPKARSESTDESPPIS